MVLDSNHKTVLMADDDEEDCMLASHALAESGAKAAFSCVEDGMKLMDYLTEHSRSEAKRLPDLILLDLNMPRKDGRQALVEIKSDPDLQHIPIVILTTSKEQKDVDLTMKAGARSFITKPADFDKWIEIMKSLADQWLIS
jgi:CheY-like chemotaxis protein